MWRREHTLSKEVTLVNNTDVTLSIVEPLTGNRESLITMKVSARAVFRCAPERTPPNQRASKHPRRSVIRAALQP